MRKPWYFDALLALFFLIQVHLSSAQQPATVLVIEGGTLIDGHGGMPVRDALIVVQGNRIATVGHKGQVAYPPNAQIIRGDGKYILPGLWDCQVSTGWYYGELMLNHGVTSTCDVGIGYELAVPHREAIFHGKIHGARPFTGIAFIDSNPGRRGTGLETPLTPSLVPKSAEDAREMVKIRIAAGADYIIFQDGGLPAEYYRAAIDEARKSGKPVFTRASGPVLGAKEAASWGAAALPHARGVGPAVAKDPSKWNNDLDRYADMDDSKAAELIRLLVQNRVALTPALNHNAPAYPKDWSRFEAEDRRLFSDPDLLAYFPKLHLEILWANYKTQDRGEVRERRRKGFQNALRFHKMFVEAGGRLLAGGDTNESHAPGLNLHHEMQVFAEAGIPPMNIILSATKWPAETLGVQDRLGTLEAGKLADILIVNKDPLQDVRNLQDIEAVIFDGKIVDRTYHAGFGDPFLMDAGDSPAVEALPWVLSLKQATFRAGGGGAAPDPVEAPQPGIETISPLMVTAGSPTTTLTLKGFNFVRRSRVYFDGGSVPYRLVTPTELQVTLDENHLRRAGRFDIVVMNPEPIATPEWGNGTSNKAHLIVNYKH